MSRTIAILANRIGLMMEVWCVVVVVVVVVVVGWVVGRLGCHGCLHAAMYLCLLVG